MISDATTKSNSQYKPALTIVVPCYNEQEVLQQTAKVLDKFVESLVKDRLISTDSRVCYVDDGSKDETWALISELAESHDRIQGLKLSRNRGHQNALFAGLMESDGDALISIDADLQDDVDVMRDMVKLHVNEATDIVYGVRSLRDSDTFFKRSTATLYYKLLKLLGVDIVYNHADYRLMSRRAIEGLREYDEVHLFLRGLVPLIGFSTEIVQYRRQERFAGESKYTLRKMLSLAWQGVTSFSIRPLRLISAFGLIVSVLAFFSACVATVSAVLGQTVPGWTSIIVAMFFLGGVQMLSIGLIGEYVGKIYMEVKNRPKYLVQDTAGYQKN